MLNPRSTAYLVSPRLSEVPEKLSQHELRLCCYQPPTRIPPNPALGSNSSTSLPASGNLVSPRLRVRQSDCPKAWRCCSLKMPIKSSLFTQFPICCFVSITTCFIESLYCAVYPFSPCKICFVFFRSNTR